MDGRRDRQRDLAFAAFAFMINAITLLFLTQFLSL
jgi:hypothetical protein